MRSWMKHSLLCFFEVVIPLSDKRLLCGTTLYLSKDKLILPDQGTSVLKRKICRCTLMTKALPHGKAFYFSASFSLVEKLARTLISSNFPSQ